MVLSREEVLATIVDIIDHKDVVTLDTIVGNDDFDSMTVLKIMMFYRSKGVVISLSEVVDCDTVGELVDIIIAKAAQQ